MWAWTRDDGVTAAVTRRGGFPEGKVEKSPRHVTAQVDSLSGLVGGGGAAEQAAVEGVLGISPVLALMLAVVAAAEAAAPASAPAVTAEP